MTARPKARCCRSSPRCARCPVLSAAARVPRPGVRGLVEQILVGSPGRPLPVAVELELADLARRRVDMSRVAAREANNRVAATVVTAAPYG